MEAQLQVGQYVLERKLGEGGMAEVWEARHIHLGTKAAIKFLLPILAADPELQNRFLKEGMRQARLQHPNIVQAIDFVQEQNRSYLIMQYVDGESLETVLTKRNGPLTMQEVHTISWDVLSALDYAHSLGVIHRDVKPSNMLIDKAGRVWLTDFGIALALGDESRLTRTGTAIGTAAFMSPEQIVRPKDVDARSDIYSFGCVLYAMLSGHPPFGNAGETDFFIKDCHVRTPPAPLVYNNPSVSPILERAVLKCLEKDPEKRFQSCSAVMSALDSAMAAPPVEGAPAVPSSKTATIAVPIQVPIPAQDGARSRTLVEVSVQPPPSLVMVPSAAPMPIPVVAAPVLPQHSGVGNPPKPVPTPRKGRKIWLAAAACLILVAAIGAYFLFVVPPKPVLRLEGSTTVGDALAPAMLKAFLASEGATDIEEIPAADGNKEHRDVRAKLHGDWRSSIFSVVANGSPNAFKALGSSRAEIGMASRPIKAEEVSDLSVLGDMKSPACEHVLALDGIAVVINRGNQVPPLTIRQLGSIFRGETADWSQVGGRPGPIHLYGRSSDSGTFDTFVALVLGGNKNAFARGLKIEANGDDIAKDVAADPGGVGYVGLAQVGEASALQLSAGPGATPLYPSQFTVATEDYVLSRRLFFYTPAKQTDFSRRFVNFALSPAGQRVVKDIGYIEQTPYFEQVQIPPDAPAAYREKVNGLRRMSVNFRFRPNSTDLDTKALADIPRVIDALSQSGIQSGVQILGFADSRGTPAQNQALSERRAQVVAQKLGGYGIQVEIAGFSSAMPVGDNATDDGREKNRRVEIWAR